jgi:hypothetical protein
MTHESLREYAAAIRPRYARATRAQKGQLLDEFCRNTDLHRKAAIRLLHHVPAPKQKRTGRPRLYGAQLAPHLVRLWDVCDRPCSKLLVAALPILVDSLERHKELRLDPEHRRQLLSLSPATIDRLLQPTRDRIGRQPHRRGSSSTSTLKKQIPLRTFGEWKDVTPGSLQGDLVLHCGETVAGFYLTTLTAVDVATSWTELEVVWGLGLERVRGAVCHVRSRLPFSLREWHVDNGAEFLNRLLVGWCRNEGIRMTRGRGYRKNDQAYVEQRNWLAVRRLVGYDRYCSRAAFLTLQRLYALYRLQLNFLRPARKLIAKQRIGSRVLKRYDRAQTPYQRLVASGVLSSAEHSAMEAVLSDLNPVTLNREIQATLQKLWNLRESHELHTTARRR